ncbi:hypothetical protein BGX26_007569 [Mortierella sp. AD094]|nr:hypothetical protein BGX26_007569 [Mortierella sp. AD094]
MTQTQPFPLSSWCGVSNISHAPHPAASPPSTKSTRPTNTSSSCAATIFDIPLIVDLICSNLTPKEIWSCYRVNTTWRDLFGIHRFQNVRFADTNPGQTWDILDNSRRIRTLKIDIAEGNLFLNSPASSWPSYIARPEPKCMNLRELACVDLRYLCDCRSQDHDWWCSPHSDLILTSALELVNRNPMLQRLEVDSSWFESNRDNAFNDQILHSLSAMRHLELIKIKVSTREQIPKILENLPESLQDLELHTQEYDDLDSLQEVTITRARNLRRLCIRGTIEWLTPSILQLFPLLEDVVLSVSDSQSEGEIKAALIAHCPKIHSIRFLGETKTISSLISTYPNGLRSLQALVPLDSGDNILAMKALLRHSLNTLETLRLNCYLRKMSIQVGTLLRSCPNLKVVSLKIETSKLKKAHGVALRDILHDKSCSSYPSRSALHTLDSSRIVDIPNHTPWACRNLEEFQLSISDTSGPPGRLSLEEKQIWTARQIGQLYQELRSLKRLTTLQLNWKCRKNDLGNKLTCETGLRIMVQHGQPKQYRMSRDDLLWMNIRWPALAEIEEQRLQEQLRLIADKEFVRRNMSRPQWKKEFKTGEPYLRRSLKSGHSRDVAKRSHHYSLRRTKHPASRIDRKITQSSRLHPSQNGLSGSVPIFDIPHVVSFICDNLTSRDIWSCYRVNKTWREAFDSHRHRTVRFVSLPASRSWDTLEDAMIQRGRPENRQMSNNDLNEIEEQETLKRLCHVAEKERTGCNSYLALHNDYEEMSSTDMFDDWPLQVNEKILNKSKRLYSNKPQPYKHIRMEYRPTPQFFRQMYRASVDFYYISKSQSINGPLI